jgi:hypothetical protein
MEIVITSFLALSCATMIFQYICYLQYAKAKKPANEVMLADLVTSN